MQYREFVDFLVETGEPFFIDVEGRPARLNTFINDYNSKFSPSISMDTEGICCLNDSVDKWGVELRIYLNIIDGMPEHWLEKAYTISHYRANEYIYRIDNNDLIRELFNSGFRIGENWFN